MDRRKRDYKNQGWKIYFKINISAPMGDGTWIFLHNCFKMFFLLPFFVNIFAWLLKKCESTASSLICSIKYKEQQRRPFCKLPLHFTKFLSWGNWSIWDTNDLYLSFVGDMRLQCFYDSECFFFMCGGKEPRILIAKHVNSKSCKMLGNI